MSRTIHSVVFILPLLPHVDPDNIVAVFDADDTLWPQFDPAANSVGVNPAKLNNFSVQNNKYYTASEKEKLFEAFRNAKLFEEVQFYSGIEKMAILHELGIKIRINSKSFTEEITEIKRRRFKTVMPFLQDSDMNLTISGGDHATTGKQIGKEVTFFIDDNPYNVATSNAIYNFLPCKVWNNSTDEQYRIRNKNFYVFDSLDSILETIIRSVHFWRNS